MVVRGNVVVRVEEIRVNGKFGIHNPGYEDDIPVPQRVLVWADGNTAFRLTGDSERFPFPDLLRIAESIPSG